MALEKELPCGSALCQSWTKAGWNEATGEREAHVLLWGGRCSPWAVLGGFTGCWEGALMKNWVGGSFGGVRSALCAVVGHSHYSGTCWVLWWCFPRAGNVATGEGHQPFHGRWQYCRGAAESFQDGGAGGIAAEGVWMELSTCALFWGVLVPCYPPTIVDFLLLIPRWSFSLLFPCMERVGWSWRFLEVAQVCNLWYEGRPHVFWIYVWLLKT